MIPLDWNDDDDDDDYDDGYGDAIKGTQTNEGASKSVNGNVRGSVPAPSRSAATIRSAIANRRPERMASEERSRTVYDDIPTRNGIAKGDDDSEGDAYAWDPKGDPPEGSLDRMRERRKDFRPEDLVAVEESVRPLSEGSMYDNDEDRFTSYLIRFVLEEMGIDCDRLYEFRQMNNQFVEGILGRCFSLVLLMQDHMCSRISSSEDHTSVTVFDEKDGDEDGEDGSVEDGEGHKGRYSVYVIRIRCNQRGNRVSVEIVYTEEDRIRVFIWFRCRRVASLLGIQCEHKESSIASFESHLNVLRKSLAGDPDPDPEVDRAIRRRSSSVPHMGNRNRSAMGIARGEGGPPAVRTRSRKEDTEWYGKRIISMISSVGDNIDKTFLS